MTNPTTIYFIRHAEPERSADSIYTDRTYPLTAKGIEDRKLVNEFLRDKNIDVVLSSPFKRAVDTVAEFAGQIGCEVELIEDFRERAITDKWLGLDEFQKFALRQWEDFSYKLPGGESIEEVQERKLAALHGVLKRHKGKNIVIGTHGMALSSLLVHYDSGFTYDRHVEMPMPYVVKMVFNGETCFDIFMLDLFNPSKKVNYDNVRVVTAELGALKAYRYTVIFARYKDKWLYCRHKERDVFETPGGGIERGETPLEGAKRELTEETGAVKFSICPAFDYVVYTETGFANGQVFYADVQELGELSENSEMTEVRGFKTIPDKMRFAKILPVLYAKIEKWHK
ncbi:MAG: histidine phosphatase family protein [Firmicutes bacterium]|nr:histidine phosphatase family protein [Bacillota bacterium]